MAAVPALHIRNVPPEVYATLKERAARNGRSLNAEVISVLEATAQREQRRTPITDELRRLAREIRLPPDAPKPEDVIREGRDERSRRF
jgi:plasmid stability protein